jgi:enamidase
VLGPITGSMATDGLECFALGDLPGIAVVLVEGVPLVHERSEQTPPPSRAVSWHGPVGAHGRDQPALVTAHGPGCC